MIKQCLKGKSVACSRSRDIKERLTWEAIGKVRLMAQIRNPGHVKPLLSLSSWYTYSGDGTVTAPTSRSVTVRLIMGYVLRLRRWWTLAKAMIVTALIINITRNSVMKIGNQTGESS